MLSEDTKTLRNFLSHKEINRPIITNRSFVFLNNYFKNNKRLKVLEFGSGDSTIWFANNSKHVVSVENDIDWYRKIKARLIEKNLLHKVDYLLTKRIYDIVCDFFTDNFFDVILIDGRDRVLCTKRSLPLLKKNGILILDNSDRIKYKEIFDMNKQNEIHFEPKIKEWSTTIWVKS